MERNTHAGDGGFDGQIAVWLHLGMRFAMRLSSAIKPVFFVAGVNHENSYVEIGDDHLHVKMGPWFDQKLPIGEISEVKPSDWPWYGGLGTKLGPEKGGVGVVGSLEGVIAIHFKSPQRVGLWIVVTDIHTECSELRVALEEPEAFVRALAEIKRSA
jgi:hypothetical protein